MTQRKPDTKKTADKLTDHEVELMRNLHEYHGFGYKRLAVKFDIPRRTVRDICNYRRRAHTR